MNNGFIAFFSFSFVPVGPAGAVSLIQHSSIQQTKTLFSSYHHRAEVKKQRQTLHRFFLFCFFSFFIAVNIRAITFHALILRCVGFFLVIIPVRTYQKKRLLNKERVEGELSDFIRSSESRHLYTI